MNQNRCPRPFRKTPTLIPSQATAQCPPTEPMPPRPNPRSRQKSLSFGEGVCRLSFRLSHNLPSRGSQRTIRDGRTQRSCIRAPLLLFPPERDLVIRHQRCSSHRPPVKLPQNPTLPHVEDFSRKSLFWNILPITPFNRIFCGPFLRLAFCFQYFARGRGRGEGPH